MRKYYFTILLYIQSNDNRVNTLVLKTCLGYLISILQELPTLLFESYKLRTGIGKSVAVTKKGNHSTFCHKHKPQDTNHRLGINQSKYSIPL